MHYQPIENYGVIRDLNTAALVSMEGSIDFMCFPRFDSPTILAALLDYERGGSFGIAPISDGFKCRQRYLPDTNIQGRAGWNPRSQLGPCGEHLGNFPRALSHIALISAAWTLDDRLAKNEMV